MKQEVIGILLPTENKQFGLYRYREDYYGEPAGTLKIEFNPYSTAESCYLYICDPKATIKEEDWYIDSRYKEIRMDQADSSWSDEDSIDYGINPIGTNKIIATTDSNLHKDGVAPISPEFLQEYVRLQSKGKIEVEMEKGIDTYGIKPIGHDKELDIPLRPKLNSKGFIELSIVEESKPFTKKEFEYQLKHVVPIDQREKWAKENWSKVVHLTKSVDQELEDAANNYAGGIVEQIDPDGTSLSSLDLAIAVKFGAQWQKEQSATDAIEFAEWCNSEGWLYSKSNSKWLKTLPYGVQISDDEFSKKYTKTSIQLYEIWQQNK